MWCKRAVPLILLVLATYVFVSNSCPRTPENALVGAPWTSCWSWEGRFGRRSCLHGRNETCQERCQPLRFYRQLFMFVRQVQTHIPLYTLQLDDASSAAVWRSFFLGFLEANKHQQTSGHILLGVARVPLLDASDHAFPDIHDLFGLSKQMYVQWVCGIYIYLNVSTNI